MTTTINASLSGGLINSADTSGILQLQTASTAAVTIDASQNVGIGSSAPTGAKLDINGGLLVSGALSANQTSKAFIEYASNVANFGAYGATAGTGEVRFSTGGGGGSGGTERMRIDSSGNVGIGTASPSAKLNVAGTTTSTVIKISTTTGASFSTYQNTGQDFYVGLDNSAGSSFGNSYSANLYGSGAYPMVFWTNAAERMRIDSSGNLLVNATSSTGHKMTVQSAAGAGGIDCVGGATNGYYAMRVDMPSTNTYGVLFRNNGNNVGDIRINSSTTTYNTSSDYRLKENIAPMTGALDKVSALKPVTYKWKSTGEESQGFIAHELQAVVPDCVTGEKDAVDEEGNPQYQGIDTSFLVATLTAAIQELNAKVDAQALEIQALKGAK